MNRRRRGGFTLMELLTTLAVIAILAAILYPVFRQVREKGRQTACISSLKQSATGMLMYCEDHDDLFPPTLVHLWDDPDLSCRTWMDCLQPYLKSRAVFVDASSGRSAADRGSSVVHADYGFSPSRRALGLEGQMVLAEPFGMAMWEGLGGFIGSPIGEYRKEVPSCCQAQVARPSETILICDHSVFDWGMMRQKLHYPAPRHFRRPDLRLPNGSRVAQGLINAAFADGHVQALQHEQFWTILRNYSQRGGPTRDVFRHFWPYE